MADTEEPQFNTLKERIAALNQQNNFNSNGADPVRKPAPPPPPGRPVAPETRSQTVPVVPSAAASNDVNGTPARASPAVPQRPSKAPPKPAPPPLPRRDTQGSVNDAASQEDRKAPPPLPGRANTGLTAPPTAPFLPRRTSNQHLAERRGSASSEVSLRSTASNVSQTHTLSSVTSHGSDGRKVPPAFNQATLPPLPPSRRELEAKAQQESASKAKATRAYKPPLPSTKSAPNVGAARSLPAAGELKSTPPPAETAKALPAAAAVAVTKAAPASKPPSLPPRLPARPAPKTQPAIQAEEPEPAPAQQQPKALPPRALPPSALKAANIIGFGSGKSAPKQQTPRPKPDERPPSPPSSRDEDVPPPIPIASRPSASQIDAFNARATSVTNGVQEDCWICRDWSGPDRVATQFPRDSLPRNDPVGHLARGLCDPFPSYTDKARAIFTWFHYNIFYDTVSFFGNCVKHMTVEETIFSGKAVCQGYAETYKAIANRAGLDCVVVGGHGKGYGHTPLKKGERPPPPKPSGHAWNAVRIDGGRWKLLDACWGAGHLDSSTNAYKQVFSPKQFISPNDDFGERHFPSDPQYQFRDDGRVISWEEYFRGRVDGPGPVVYTTGHEEGILEKSVEPKERQIPVNSGEVVRIQFSKLCQHWRSETHGKGKAPLLLLSIHGLDGRKDEMIPIETDGYWHWIDVNARDLGAPGQTLQVAILTKVDGKDARGMSARDYLSKRGRVCMAWSYVLKWELV